MGTMRPPYQQKYFFRPIGAFFLLKLKVAKMRGDTGKGRRKSSWLRGDAVTDAAQHQLEQIVRVKRNGLTSCDITRQKSELG